MERTATILVTGAGGMVGKATERVLLGRGFTRLLTPTHGELELRDPTQVDAFFKQHRPHYVFMIAARVGGIGANVANPVPFLDDNLRIQCNLFAAAHRFGVEKSLFLGSSCVYPRDCPQPMREEYLLTGPLEPTNEAYALAKIAGLKLADAYRAQFGLRTVCPMSSNIYGTGDTFDLAKSHVLSALVRRFVDAEREQSPSVTLWGTGSARREFLHVEDLAEALVMLMERYEDPRIINVGSGTDVSIRELAELIARNVGYRGEIGWDSKKPDGMPRKVMDVSRLSEMGFVSKVDLNEGIQRTVQEYRRLAEAEAR